MGLSYTMPTGLYFDDRYEAMVQNLVQQWDEAAKKRAAIASLAQGASSYNPVQQARYERAYIKEGMKMERLQHRLDMLKQRYIRAVERAKIRDEKLKARFGDKSLL